MKILEEVCQDNGKQAPFLLNKQEASFRRLQQSPDEPIEAYAERVRKNLKEHARIAALDDSIADGEKDYFSKLSTTIMHLLLSLNDQFYRFRQGEHKTALTTDGLPISNVETFLNAAIK
jgi:hypothetical protein